MGAAPHTCAGAAAQLPAAPTGSPAWRPPTLLAAPTNTSDLPSVAEEPSSAHIATGRSGLGAHGGAGPSGAWSAVGPLGSGRPSAASVATAVGGGGADAQLLRKEPSSRCGGGEGTHGLALGL